jgi:hypothetical protein
VKCCGCSLSSIKGWRQPADKGVGSQWRRRQKCVRMSHGPSNRRLSALSGVAVRLKVPGMAATTVPIYRIGIQKNDLLCVRDQDVSIYSDPAEVEICVQPQSAQKTPGISCWHTRQAATAAASAMARRSGWGTAPVWELPAGSNYDDAVLRLWQPRADKWYWSPSRNMRGSEFIAALRAVNTQFR